MRACSFCVRSGGACAFALEAFQGKQRREREGKLRQQIRRFVAGGETLIHTIRAACCDTYECRADVRCGVFPNFVGSLGLPDVTTSYGYLINGLVGIYVGPALLKSLSGKLGRTACVVISLLLAGASVLILNIDLPLVIVLVSVALLGLFDGFGTPATSDYYVNMPAVRKAGVSQGLAMLNVVGSIVQTFSPVLYSAILAGGNAGTNIMGFSFIAAAVLFIVTLRMDAEKKQRSGSLNQ